MEKIKVLSIDIGITNLGYVYAEVTLNTKDLQSRYKSRVYNENYILNTPNIKNDITILDCNRVDITKVKHKLVNYCVCKLHHDRCIPDYLDHFIQETPHFNDCDILLLERQPPVGITNVQDLLFKLFREKVFMVSPGSVHKYFGMKRNDYTVRKEQSEDISKSYLVEFDTFTKNIRKHDISDSMLMVIYYYKLRMETLIENAPIKKTSCDFEQFRF